MDLNLKHMDKEKVLAAVQMTQEEYEKLSEEEKFEVDCLVDYFWSKVR